MFGNQVLTGDELSLLNWNLCENFIFNLIKYFICFSNHFEGQDILHVDVYDEDSLKKDKTGSFTIDLHDLYKKSIFH